MAKAASAHQTATASREGNGQEIAGRTRRTSADPKRAQQGATAAASAAPAALDSLSRLQQLANASPQVAQLRRLQALADGHYAPVAQLAGGPEQKELVQGKIATAQLPPQLQQAHPTNNTNLPDQLKSGTESLSALSLDHVRVDYNSAQPAQLNALAYAQGSDIHLVPGQERPSPSLQLMALPMLDPGGTRALLWRMDERSLGSCFGLEALPSPEPLSSIASDTGGVAQRIKVYEDYDSYLNGAVPGRDNIRAYFYKYEVREMVRKVMEYGQNDELISRVTRNYAAYQQRFAAAATSHAANWNAVAAILRNLVTNINAALAGIANVPTGYENGEVGNWADARTAVTAAHGVVNADVAGVAPQSDAPDARRIPTIDYSAAIGVFPQSLVRLLRDIHAAWKTGDVFDQRSQTDQQNRTLNADDPGALRSWHMNTSRTLPAAPEGVPTPDRANALEEHYTNTSGVMNALGVIAAHPIGFSEYTGTGIRDDAHNSKIVLDYRQGHIYLTLTHYQHWAGDETFGQVPSAAGTHSPWFKINMDA